MKIDTVLPDFYLKLRGQAAARNPWPQCRPAPSYWRCRKPRAYSQCIHVFGRLLAEPIITVTDSTETVPFVGIINGGIVE